MSCGLDVDITAIAASQSLHFLHHITPRWVQDHISTTLLGYLQLEGRWEGEREREGRRSWKRKERSSLLTFQSKRSRATSSLGLLSRAVATMPSPRGPQPDTTTVSLNWMEPSSTAWMEQARGSMKAACHAGMDCGTYTVYIILYQHKIVVYKNIIGENKLDLK